MEEVNFQMYQLTDKEVYDLVNTLSLRYFHKPFLHEVKFNHRLRTTGGRYIPAKKLIELNPKYLEKEDEFIGIIKHELCHYHLHIEGKGYNMEIRISRGFYVQRIHQDTVNPFLHNKNVNIFINVKFAVRNSGG
jgi:predicted SprT family Zn-dependent metalloprotease